VSQAHKVPLVQQAQVHKELQVYKEHKVPRVLQVHRVPLVPQVQAHKELQVHKEHKVPQVSRV
jgi:hypothetical protein